MEAEPKSGKQEALQKIIMNTAAKDTIEGRLSELDSLWSAARGVCLVDVTLELELEKQDMDDALETDDPKQLASMFPALTPLDCQKLRDILRKNQAEFEQIAEGNPGVVTINYAGCGVHCGDGWVMTDNRLLTNLTQVKNAAFTFVAADGRNVKFEPEERFAFGLVVKPAEFKKLSGWHPNVGFVKLGIQGDQDRPQEDIEEWELAEQKLLDSTNLPTFKLPMFNDLEIGKKYSVVQISQPEQEKDASAVITALLDEKDVIPSVNEGGSYFMKMKVGNLQDYLPQSGAIVYSQDGDRFTICGFIYGKDDQLLSEDATVNPPSQEFLPLYGDTLAIFLNAKNFLLNRAGQRLTKGQSIAYNYQMMAEFAKGVLVSSLAGFFDMNFVHPRLDEHFSQAHVVDATNYFKTQAAEGFP